MEAEQEIDMEDKEATPVEDIEKRLPPAEPTEPIPQGKQADKPEQTEEINFQETLVRMMMEMREASKKAEENSKKSREELALSLIHIFKSIKC